jgi:hypothetical protein
MAIVMGPLADGLDLADFAGVAMGVVALAVISNEL